MFRLVFRILQTIPSKASNELTYRRHRCVQGQCRKILVPFTPFISIVFVLPCREIVIPAKMLYAYVPLFPICVPG